MTVVFLDFFTCPFPGKWYAVFARFFSQERPHNAAKHLITNCGPLSVIKLSIFSTELVDDRETYLELA